MKRLIAYLRARPKSTIAGALVLVFVAASAWNAFAPARLVTTPWSGNVSVTSVGAPMMGVSERAVSGSIAFDSYAEGAPAKAPMADIGIMPPVPNPSAGQTAAEVDQKIVKNGYLQLMVDKVSDSAVRVGQIATARGGFVQSSSVSERGDGTYSGDVSVRVPVDKFEETMSEIKKLATLVKSDTSTGQDVTEQYTDLQAQLRNAKAQEDTYLEILKQSKTVSDTLQVQQQLGYIRGTIESLQGRIQYLTNTTSYSTISVSLEEEPVVRAPTKEFRLGAIIKTAVQTLVAAAQDLVAGLIYTVIVWGGILLPIGLLAWIGWMIWKRRKTR